MPGRRPRPDPFDADTARRLRAIGPYQVASGPGYCEISWGAVGALACDFAAFNLEWTLGGPGRAGPGPDGRMFEIWERYRARHQERCAEYRRRLFEWFSARPESAYEPWQWRALGRRRPSPENPEVTGPATVSLSGYRDGAAAEYALRVCFVVFWEAHGIVFRLDTEGDEFAVVAWGAGEA